MASIDSFAVEGEAMFVKLRISEAEYGALDSNVDDLILVPASDEAMDVVLTTGKLGNSNRIMCPTKVLKQLEMDGIDKKVPAKIFRLRDAKFLVIKLESEIPTIGFKEVPTHAKRDVKKKSNK